MHNPPDYSIGHPIISKYEKELIASLTQLYPDEGERLIVETVLIPHFRAKLQEVFDDFLEARSKGPSRKKCDVPVAPYEVPELCSRIEGMIKVNRGLLAVGGIFKPALKEIQQSRIKVKEELNEESRQSFIGALAVHGITDRQSLFRRGPAWFVKKEATFPPYGQGKSFLKAILGRSVNSVNSEILEEVADILGFEKPTEQDERQKQLALLAGYGITDRQSLLMEGAKWYRSKEAKFPPYGGGRAFIGAILGRTISIVTVGILEEVADVFGFAKPAEEDERQKQLELLATHGITDRTTLLEKTAVWFKKKRFPPYGGGGAFIGAILGRTISVVTVGTLEEVAEAFGFEKPAEEDERQKQLKLLAGYGITDRQSLLQKGVRWFSCKEVKFSPYGGGKAFIGAILGKTIYNINLETLEEVADVLGFEKPTEQDERQKQLELLADYGITDRLTLLQKGVVWFSCKEVKFPPYGGGRAFVRAILGRSVPEISLEVLEEVADALGFDKLTSQGERQKQLGLLAVHGIIDRESMLKKGAHWFSSKEAKFSAYGGGQAFIGAILGRSVIKTTLGTLEEVADVLFAEQERKQFFDSSVITQVREQLASELTKLYPEKAERAIIESIILPQLFLNLEAVFAETAKKNPGKLSQSVSIHQIPELCEVIDEMIQKNRSLLCARDIGRPLLDRLQMLRAEARRQLEANFRESNG